MKVLVAHNRYRSSAPSGENRVVDEEIELLRNAGVDVVPMIEESDRIAEGGVRALAGAAVGPIYSPSGVARFKQLLRDERPDVVHLHNVFPLISPWVIRVAHAAGVPVVQTVHNYRHSCVNGLHFRDGATCTSCLGRRLPLAAVGHRCYRGSTAQSAAMVAGHVAHASAWRQVDHYLTLTPFMRDRLEETGVERARISVRASWVPQAAPAGAPGRDVLFVGRLDEAKGVRLLLEAWADGPMAGRRLAVAGDGGLRGEVEHAAARGAVDYLGPLDAGGVREALSRCGLVVVPSLCFEGLPLVIAEAFRAGRAVAVADGGSAASAVGAAVGWVFTPSASALRDVVSAISDEELQRRGAAARHLYESDHSPEAALRSLVAVYDRLLAEQAA